MLPLESGRCAAKAFSSPASPTLTTLQSERNGSFERAVENGSVAPTRSFADRTPPQSCRSRREKASLDCLLPVRTEERGFCHSICRALLTVIGNVLLEYEETRDGCVFFVLAAAFVAPCTDSKAERVGGTEETKNSIQPQCRPQRVLCVKHEKLEGVLPDR